MEVKDRLGCGGQLHLCHLRAQRGLLGHLLCVLELLLSLLRALLGVLCLVLCRPELSALAHHGEQAVAGAALTAFTTRQPRLLHWALPLLADMRACVVCL